MPATGMHSIEQGRGYNRSIVIVRPYPFCLWTERWHGNDCPTAWPVSRFAWCGPCADFEAAK